MTPSDDHAPARRLIILGSTGSIGVNALQVADHLNQTGQMRLEVVGLAAGNNAQLLIDQAKARHVEAVAIADDAQRPAITAALPDAGVFTGPDAAKQLIESTQADMIVAAIVGSAGLPATLAAIELGMDIALANKETLVAAGELVMPLVAKHGVQLLPVDSEHSAIFQCLAGQNRCIKRIVLTASGGPFRTASAGQIRHATVDEALNHPTWNMGPKITIDSATMMNKALEIIEAHWLFGLSAEQIQVIIHPQSIAHSFVEFADHSILAQMGTPDMRTPIQYALTHPRRATGCSRPLDWATLSRLDFEPPDHERFGALKLAYRVVEAGGVSGAVLNAANEAAVAAFLARRIEFGRIVELVAQALDEIPNRPAADLDTIENADRAARIFVGERIGR